MSSERLILSYFARRHPEVFDVPRHGPLLVAINPQPLPPGGEASLNPQPLPPRELGVRVANELLHLSWIADRLHQDVTSLADWEDDPCPTWPHGPKLPPHLGPDPEPEPHPEWLLEYHFGLVTTLAAATGSVGASRLVEEGLERSLGAMTVGLNAAATVATG